MTKVHEDLRGDTKLQARKKPSSIQITLSRYKGTTSTDGPTKPGKEWMVKVEIRLTTREAFCMSYQELRSVNCKNERAGRKLICVGCYPPKPLSLASLVNLGTRFLLRGVVLSHPEIFEFQDVINIKNK